MDPEVREAVRRSVEDDTAHVAVVGRSSLERKEMLKGIVARRESPGNWAIMEDYRDWRRVLDGEFDTIIIRAIEQVTDQRQGDLVEGLRDGDWVVVFGVEDLQEAVACGDLREDLYDQLDPLVVETDEMFGAWYEDSDVEAILDEALLPEAERPSASTPELPDDLQKWCERAGFQPADTSRQSHLEEDELWTIQVDAGEVERPWHALMNERDGTGYYPVVTGAEDPIANRRGSIEKLLEEYHPNAYMPGPERTMAQWLDGARRLEVDEWIQTELDRFRAESLGSDYFESDAVDSEGSSGFPDPKFTRRNQGTFGISLVPVDGGWKVPAFFHYGGFVPNPTPDRHAALLKRWAKTRGVRLASLTVDTMELYIEEPIRDADSALQMAREYLVYGSAEVYYDTLGELAGALYGEDWINLYFDTI